VAQMVTTLKNKNQISYL